MYKVIFDVNKGEINIIQISKQEGNDWVMLKDPELLSKIEDKFIRTRGAFFSGKGYGQVIYNENLSYISGNFEPLKD
jgi:hypothetical protein